MAEHIIQESSLSGKYLFNGDIIEPMPYFVYEFSCHKYWKGGYCLLKDKFYKSGRLLDIKHPRVVKYYDGYSITKEMVLIGAPKEFIMDMKLPSVLQIIKKKNGTRRSTKRPVH